MDDPGSPTTFKTDFERLVRAQTPLIHINTFEEDRVVATLLHAARHIGRHVLMWSTARGVFNPNVEVGEKGHALPLADLAAALQAFEQTMENRHAQKDGMLFVLFDPYPYLSDRASNNPVYRRRLREFVGQIRTEGWPASCVIVAPSLNVPYELEHDVTVIDYPLPTRQEVRAYVARFIDGASRSGAVAVPDDPEALIDQLADAAVGLSQRELENAIAYATVDDLAIDESDVQQIFRQKRQAIRKSGLLEFVDTGGLSLDDVGGLARLKRWLHRRRHALGRAGAGFGLAVPKGVLLTGVPGCGKSWSARCVAAAWGLPLVRLDMGRIFDSLVGASEAHMRNAIAVSEAVSPCILWIDEIEKGLSRPGQQVGDSGVSLRVLGTFLTWLQEKTSPVFVVATANDILHLPPEIVRKGRFDAVFFVDLPDEDERRAILEIHLKRVDRAGDPLDLDALVELSGSSDGLDRGGMTGAEIAAWVDDAMLYAFERSLDGEASDLSHEDFARALDEMPILAKIRDKDIAALRGWATAHAQPAS